MQVVALAVFFNRLGSGTIALTFLSLRDAVGTFAAFTLYAALGATATVYYWLVVPDLSGQALEASSGAGETGPVLLGAGHASSSEPNNDPNDAVALRDLGAVGRPSAVVSLSLSEGPRKGETEAHVARV